MKRISSHQRALLLACASLAFCTTANAQTTTYGFTGAFSPSNWFGSNYSFASGDLVIGPNGYAQAYTSLAGTADFFYSGTGSYSTGAMGPPAQLSGGGSGSITYNSPAYLDFNGPFGFGGNLTISFFSFTSIPPALTSDLAMLPGGTNIAVFKQPLGSSVDIPITVSNAGPQSANYTISDDTLFGPTPHITRVGGTGSNTLSAGQSNQLFTVHVNTDTLTTEHLQYSINNLSEPGDRDRTFDNTTVVNLYVDSEPSPVAFLKDYGLGQSGTSIQVPVDVAGPNGSKSRAIILENQITNGSNTANARLLDQTVNSSAFTFYDFGHSSEFIGNYEITQVFTTAPNLLNGHYEADYLATFGPGFAKGSEDASYIGVDFVSNNRYYVSAHLSADITDHAGGGTSPVAAHQPYAGLSASSDAGHGTMAELVGGSTGASPTDVSISFSPGGNFDVGGLHPLGDVVSLTGTSGTLFALQLFIPDADLGSYTGTPEVDLKWKAPSGLWDLAYTGDSNPFIYQLFSNTAYDPSLLSLGNYGFNYVPGGVNVWAVIDHNSLFAAAPIPEPATLGLLLTASVGLIRRRRR